jgi:predicted nucleic acid-binding protein
MRVLRIYLETSIFNFIFADDAPDKKADTLTLFEEIKAGKHQAFTSVHVFDELDRAQEPKRSKMYGLIKEYGIEVLSNNAEIESLADIYVAEKMIPAKYADDALHIATASVWGLDVVVSWNFRHIVKLKTIRQTEILNFREGYKRVLIHSPTEVIDYE